MVTSAELAWLLAMVAKGDRDAFERLYRATGARLYGVVLRIVRRPDRAAAILQDSYLAVWTSAGQFDPATASAMPWMVSIARHRALDSVRRNTEVSPADEPDILEGAAETPEPLEPRVMTDELRRLLACLGRLEPDRQRMVLLAYYSGAGRDQLARELDRSVDTIRTQLRRALADLRECLES